jgi:hypothetical protein
MRHTYQLVLLGLAICGALAPSVTAAHAFGARYDLPLPLGLYLAAAGLAVGASFLGVFWFLRRNNSQPVGIEFAAPACVGRVIVLVLRTLGLFVLTAVLAAAAFGPEEATNNLATVTVWVLWWVGFLLFSALLIPLWPAVDPFRALYLIFCKLTGRDPESAPLMLPRFAGWLAPLGLLVIAWVELVSDWSEDPRSLAALIGLYALTTLAGAIGFGMAWFRIADPLGRIFELFSRMAPLLPLTPAGLRLRPPGEGLVDPEPAKAGEVVLIIGLIGMVLFDGLSETPFWAAVLDFVSESQTLRPALLWMRDQGVDLLKAVRTTGLAATILVFLSLYLLLAGGMRALAGAGVRYWTIAVEMAGSLLPIAVAYHLSHYISYLLMAGQLIGPTASDPLGRGWDLFGRHDATIDVGVIGAEQVWWIAVGTLIAGHSLSVLVGHRRALVLFGAAGSAARSQVPMFVAMVGLTILSLWILAQPLIAF